MNCQSFRQQASLYIDHQLDAVANQEFLYHLNSCTGCYEYIDEIRQTASLLRQLGPAAPPPDLANNIIAQLNAAQACKPSASPSLATWIHSMIFYSRPQYISYATGFIITCLLFAGVISGFKPQFPDTLVSVLTPPGELIEVPLPSAPDSLPIVESTSTIADLTFQADQQTPTKDLFVVAEVSPEGRAHLIQLVDAPKNQKLERNVADTLKRASFKPAMRDGRPVQSHMLLLIQTIDVQG